MKTIRNLAVAAAVLALVTPAFAGGPECEKAAKANAVAHKKCSVTAEECQKYMQEARNKWLGVELEDADMVTITRVVPGSPAETAGFRKGDVLVALNGVTISEENQEKIKAVRKNLKAGDTVAYTIRRGGLNQDLRATLARMPDDVYTAWTKEHMQEEHVAVAAK